MSQPSPSNLDADLATHLGRSRTIVVPGFAERVVSAVHAESRRRIIRWSSLATTLAACLVATLIISRSPSEEFLIQQSQLLVQSDEASQYNAIFGVANDLAMLNPVVEKNSGVVDELIKSDI